MTACKDSEELFYLPESWPPHLQEKREYLLPKKIHGLTDANMLSDCKLPYRHEALIIIIMVLSAIKISFEKVFPFLRYL